jgi:hypothetical protein
MNRAGSAGGDKDSDDYFSRYEERMASPQGHGTPGSHRPIQLEDRGYYGGSNSPLEIPMGPSPAGGLGRVGTPSDRLQGQPTVCSAMRKGSNAGNG